MLMKNKTIEDYRKEIARNKEIIKTFKHTKTSNEIDDIISSLIIS
jgi:hypothetical protein